MTLRISVQPLRGSALVEGYLRGEETAARFFEGRPFDLASYRRKLEETRARFDRPARERAAAALRPTSARAAERLRRFVEEGGAMVTTGQQAGLFTGPMYTVHKILSAIRLAGALEAELGCVVLPVFWVASEDHDWDEANHTFAVDGAGELRRFALRATDARPVPMSEMRMGDDVKTVSGEFTQLLASQSDDAHDLDWIRDAYQSGMTVSEAFGATVERLFADFDLLVTDAADPALKVASLPVLVRELERAAEHERVVAARTAELAEAGYTTQVVVVEGATNLFFHGPAGRERLAREGGGFVAADARRHFTADEAADAVRADPVRFSPNVLLRPVVESAVFPTLAYVAGPGEAAYFAQIGPLFRAFDIVPPVVFPRFSALLVPSEIDDALAEAGLSIDDLRPPLHEVVQGLARRRLPTEVARGIAGLRESIVAEYARLMDVARPIDPNLDGALGSSRNRALLEADRAERKILAHQKRRDAELTRAVATARAHLFPNGVPQERALNVFPYLARYGPGLLSELAAEMTVRWEAEPAPV